MRAGPAALSALLLWTPAFAEAPDPAGRLAEYIWTQRPDGRSFIHPSFRRRPWARHIFTQLLLRATTRPDLEFKAASLAEAVGESRTSARLDACLERYTSDGAGERSPFEGDPAWLEGFILAAWAHAETEAPCGPASEEEP